MTAPITGIAAVGDVLAGKYRVEQILGIGGMGMVVAATHLEIDQRVALKFMLPSATESPDAAARFLREARAAGRLNSNHVCRVMDVGRFTSGAPYIVMEYLQGESMAAMLRRRGPLRVAEAVDLVLQAIEGLAEAHAHGIIHRDLKPDNLFLARRNDGAVTVKVLDFGISKIAVTGVSTSTGDIMGSPAYMAPEQMLSSRDVDSRADIWSTGVVLYQAITGKLPFHGESLPVLCTAVMDDEPAALHSFRDDLPAGFAAIVMKCLRKQRAGRYLDVGELATALVPYGPPHASASASRSQIVLRRIGDALAATSHEFSTVEPTLDSNDKLAHGDPAAPTSAPPIKEVATTLGGTSGQALGSRPPERRRWGLIGGISAAVGLVAILLVVAWRTGLYSSHAAPTAPAATAPATPVTAAPAASAPAAPAAAMTVEPITGSASAGSAAAAPIEPAPTPAAPTATAAAADQAAGTASSPSSESQPPARDPHAQHAAGQPAGAATAAKDPGAARRRTAAAKEAAAKEAAAKEAAAKEAVAKEAAAKEAAAKEAAAKEAAAKEAAAKTGTGSAAPSDDDKWSHMTHDKVNR